nr:O-antigen ligase family protein [Chloroflexota bacterium]
MASRPLSRPNSLLPVIFGLLALLVGAGSGLLVMGISSPMRVLLLTMGITAFVATVTQIRWGLLVVIFIIYTRFSDVAVKFHGVSSVAKSFILVLLLAIVIRWILRAERPTGWVRPALLIAGYGAVGFASLLYAADFNQALSAALEFVKDGVIAVVVIFLLQSGAMFRRVIWTLLLAGIFMGTLSVYQYATGTFNNNYWGFAQAPLQNIVGQTSDHRSSGPIGDPNYYAQMMLVLVPLALDRVWNERQRRMKLLAVWALAVSSLAIVFSFSRGGFIALLVMLGAMLAYRRQRPINWLIALAIGLVLLQFVPATYTQRLQTIVEIIPGFGNGVTTTGPNEASLRGRTSELIVAVQMFADRPILGVGLGNYSFYYQSYSRRLGMDPRVEPREAHNLYLEVAAETGLLGLSMFGILLWVMFTGILRARHLLVAAKLTRYLDIISAYTFSLVGYLTASLFIHAAYPRYLWLLVGIALAIPRVAQHELAEHLRAQHEQAEA